MSRAAKIGGGIAFAITLFGVGAVAWALLAIRSPLAGGGVAPGPEPAAYAVIGAAVLAGAVAVGGLVALAVELIVRTRR